MSVIVSMNLWIVYPSDLSVNLSSISYQSHAILHFSWSNHHSPMVFLWFSYGFPTVFRWKSSCSPPKCESQGSFSRSARCAQAACPEGPEGPTSPWTSLGSSSLWLKIGHRNGGFSHPTWWCSIVLCMFMVEDWIGITVWLFNVAMENHHFG